jgi:hypothetical protein
MSSRLNPLKEPAVNFTTLTMFSTDFERTKIGTSCISPKILNRKHFPPINDISTSETMSPKLSTTVQSITTEMRFKRRTKL